jgi:hypothetical protein
MLLHNLQVVSSSETGGARPTGKLYLPNQKTVDSMQVSAYILIINYLSR